jgi:hypothetical protein
VTIRAYYAVNATKAGIGLSEAADPWTWARTLEKETMKQLEKGTMFKLTTLGYHIMRDEAFGPFEEKGHAEFIIPSPLNEEGQDWKGEKWAVASLPMVQKEFLIPHWQVRRVYLCEACGSKQPFKGSCAKCRTDGTNFQPTIEIKDWENEINV